MFEDYKKSVLDDYDQKKVSDKLSLEMMNTTPANLKDECIIVCDTRFDEKGESLLKSFFGAKDDQTAYRMAIKKHGTTKCKPLSNFLKKRTIDTEDKNIELLAWLIDYEPRPYSLWLKKQDGKKPTSPKLNSPVDLTEPPGKIELTDEPPTRVSRYILAALLLLVLTSGTVYWMWPKPSPEVISKPLQGIVKGKCMYWAGSNYLPCACNVLHRDTPVVALDTIKLAGFKKITDESTLSKNSIKKVWWGKINGDVEFFTAEGFHPVDTNRRLLPLSAYMLNKYVLHKQ